MTTRPMRAAGKSLGLSLQHAQWLGKGKRLSATVVEPTGIAQPTSAAKEEGAEEIEHVEPAHVPPTLAPVIVADTSPLAAVPAPKLPPMLAMPAATAEDHAEQTIIKGELLLALGERHWPRRVGKKTCCQKRYG